MDYPNITVESERKLYSTYESCDRPFFGEISIPPLLKDYQLTYDHAMPTHRMTLLNIMNPILVATDEPAQESLSFDIHGTSTPSQLFNARLTILTQTRFTWLSLKLTKTTNLCPKLTQLLLTSPNVKRLTFCWNMLLLQSRSRKYLLMKRFRHWNGF